jgi:hypothetical protein
MEADMKMVRMAAILALLGAASTPGLAVPRRGEAGYDPDRYICKSRPAIGSRVKRIRECHTAQQWEEREFQERAGLMRRQTNGAPGCNLDPPAFCGIVNSGKDTPF